MSLCCMFGVCIPYSVLWPFVLLLFKPLFEYISNLAGLKHSAFEKVTGNTEKEKTCCNIKSAKSGIFNLEIDDDWTAIANESTGVTFIRFSAKWCVPCQKIEPVFMELGQQNPSMNFVTIDVDQYDEIAASYSALSIPLFVAVKNGIEIGRLAGKDEDGLKLFINNAIQKKD